MLRFRNLIFKDVLGVLEDWGFDHIKCFTFITQIREGHKISLKIRITGSNGLNQKLHKTPKNYGKFSSRGLNLLKFASKRGKNRHEIYPFLD